MRRAIAFVVVVAGLMPASAGRSGQAYGQTPPDAQNPAAPVSVLSDTAEYCSQLEHRIMGQPVRSAEVRRMVSKGHQLCDHGQVRRGVSFLRRALIMQRSGSVP